MWTVLRTGDWARQTENDKRRPLFKFIFLLFFFNLSVFWLIAKLRHLIINGWSVEAWVHERSEWWIHKKEGNCAWTDLNGNFVVINISWLADDDDQRQSLHDIPPMLYPHPSRGNSVATTKHQQARDSSYCCYFVCCVNRRKHTSGLHCHTNKIASTATNDHDV